MKQILCFGDSNTYGYMPETGGRYSETERWSGIFKDLCQGKFDVVEAGCNNRTAFQKNPMGKEYVGYEILPKYLDESFDIVILFIGINDAQRVYNRTISEIKDGVEKLVQLAKELCPRGEIILVAPSHLGDGVLRHSLFSQLFDRESIEKSKFYSRMYYEVSMDNGCKFIDLDVVVSASDIDGLHYSKDSHQVIAKTFYKNIIQGY